MRIDSDKVKQASAQIISAFKTYAEEYMANSERYECTPTEEKAIEDVFTDAAYIYEKNPLYTSMNSEEQAEVRDRTKKEIERNTKDAYRYSLERKHRQVNGFKPYNISNSEKADCWDAINNIRQFVNYTVNTMLNKCFQQGKLPSREAMGNYITSCFDAGLNKYAPDLSAAQRAFCRQQIEHKRENYLGLYDDLASRMKVTGTFPSDIQIDTGVANRDDNGHTAAGRKEALPDNSTKEIVRPTGKGLVSEWARTNVSFSGADMVVSASMATSNGSHVFVTLGSLQTLSYSIYRKLSPILNIGNINAKDYVGGPRTIAGSLVFTVFNKHWGSELLDKFISAEGYAANRKLLMDEVAPIDLTISMANEYGVCSRIAIYGVRLFSEGQVMSINDMYTENTYQYVALNIDYLADINVVNNIWGKDNPESYAREAQVRPAAPPAPTMAAGRGSVVTDSDSKNSSSPSSDTSDKPNSSTGKSEGAQDSVKNRAASSDTEQPSNRPGQAPDLRPAGRPGQEDKPTSAGRTTDNSYTTGFDGLPFFYKNYKNRQDALKAASVLLATHKDRYKQTHSKAPVGQITRQNELYDAEYRKLVSDINEHYS